MCHSVCQLLEPIQPHYSLLSPRCLSVGKLSCSVNVMVKTKVLEHFQIPKSWSMKTAGLVNTWTILWTPETLCIKTQAFLRNYGRMVRREDEGKTEIQYRNQLLGLARARKENPHTVTPAWTCGSLLIWYSVREIFSALSFAKEG